MISVPNPALPALSEPPHVLVADDDASTRQFMASALGSLGYRSTLASDGEQALQLARRHRYDALLLDCRMPGAGARAIFEALRHDASAASHGAVAFATSADMPASLRSDLLAEGFAGVLEKPCRVATLGQALLAMLGVDPRLLVLDDEESLKATGDAATMRALRELLRGELVELLGALDGLAGQPTELVERLHRLRSACGFCGTRRLGEQARALQGHVEDAQAVAPAALARFRGEVEVALVALGDR